MSDNWEHALRHVSDGFVTYLGDDDGLLPGSLAELDRIIRETGCEAISWKRAPYFWPGCDQYWGNTLTVPLRTSLQERASDKYITDVINFTCPYPELPLLYNSFVSYKAISRVMEESGRFYHSMTPDVYSGLVLASVMDSYYYSSAPYTLEGISRHSNGRYLASSNPHTAKAAQKFLGEKNIPFHEKLVACPSLPIIMAEAFLQARDHVLSMQRFNIDLQQVLQLAARQTVRAASAQYETTMAAIRRIGELNGLEDYVMELLRMYKNKPLREAPPALGVNIISRNMVLDCSDFGVRNVYEASLLCKHAMVLERCNYSSGQGIARTTLRQVRRQITKRWL
jgi:hypothetical protein